ncbi:MAG: hypothetical protein WBE26_05135 [Phycisphaerae bacterium]
MRAYLVDAVRLAEPEAASFQKHAESAAALALDPPPVCVQRTGRQRAAIALVGQRGVLVQLNSAARRASWPLDGDRGQASPLYPIRFGFNCRFDHAALRSVSPAVSETVEDSQEFRRFFP